MVIQAVQIFVELNDERFEEGGKLALDLVAVSQLGRGSLRKKTVANANLKIYQIMSKKIKFSKFSKII